METDESGMVTRRVPALAYLVPFFFFSMQLRGLAQVSKQVVLSLEGDQNWLIEKRGWHDDVGRKVPAYLTGTYHNDTTGRE